MTKRLNGGLSQRIGLSETAFATFGVEIPDDLKFAEIKQALAARCTPVIVRVETPSFSTNGNRKVLIKLPNKDILNLRKGHITFDAQIQGNGTRMRIAEGISSIFDRIVVRSGSQILEERKNYNKIFAMLNLLQNDPDTVGDIGMRMGYGLQSEREAVSGNGVITNYACPLSSGILGTEILPTGDLALPIEIELWIADPNACLETDSTVSSITLTNVQFRCERYEVEDSYKNFISSFIQKNGLKLGFHSWELYITPLTTALTQQLVINNRNSSVNGLINTIMPSDTQLTTTLDDRMTTWLPNNLGTNHTNVNGSMFNEEPTDLVTNNRWDAYKAYLRWVKMSKLDIMRERKVPINSTQFAIDKFVQIDDFEPFPTIADNIINPFTTLENGNNIMKKLTFTSAPPANRQLETLVEFFTQVNIYPNGTASVSQ